MSTNGKNEAPKVVKVPTPDEGVVEVIGAAPPASVSESEIKAQIDVAKKYPRDPALFLKDAIKMVTLTEEIAESCIYSVKRGQDNVVGKSVRLAEICLSAWGNCYAGARPIEVGQRDVTSQGVCWDVQRNVRITMESKRSIVTRNGTRYSEDMIVMTQMAAASIALRNAILRVIPSAYTDEVYRAARACAVGEGENAASRRAKVLQKLGKMGATADRVLAVMGKASIEEITLDDVEILVGYGTAIKDGEKTVDELFPPIQKPAAPAAATAATPVTVPAAAQAQTGATGEASASSETAKPSSTPPPPRETSKPRQGTLAAVAARKPGATKPTDDGGGLISSPPPRLASVPADPDAADRAAAAPTEKEIADARAKADADGEPLPPWAQ